MVFEVIVETVRECDTTRTVSTGVDMSHDVYRGATWQTLLVAQRWIFQSPQLVSMYEQLVSMYGLGQEGGSLITPMALAHPLHPIDNRSRNKRRNLWVG